MSNRPCNRTREARARSLIPALMLVGALLTVAACSSSATAAARSADPTSAATQTPAPSATGPTDIGPQAAAVGAHPLQSNSTATLDARVVVARSTVAVLCYHQIQPSTKKGSRWTASITTPTSRFADHIRALKKAGYHAITPEQLSSHLVNGTELPAKPVLITFDDGTRPQWTVAGPILRKAGYTATYFLMTVVLNKGGWLRDSDLRAMRTAGMTIGSHTWDHHDVRHYSAKDWKVQLRGSMATLAKATGEPVTTLAYPYGAWNKAALGPVAKSGITLAFQLTDKPVDPKAPLLTQRRLLVLGAWSGEDLLRHLRAAFPR